MARSPSSNSTLSSSGSTYLPNPEDSRYPVTLHAHLSLPVLNAQGMSMSRTHSFASAKSFDSRKLEFDEKVRLSLTFTRLHVRVRPADLGPFILDVQTTVQPPALATSHTSLAAPAFLIASRPRRPQ